MTTAQESVEERARQYLQESERVGMYRYSTPNTELISDLLSALELSEQSLAKARELLRRGLNPVGDAGWNADTRKFLEK